MFIQRQRPTIVSVELCGGVHTTQRQRHSANFHWFCTHFIGICIGLGVGKHSEFRNLDFLLTFVCVHLLTANKIYQNKVLGKTRSFLLALITYTLHAGCGGNFSSPTGNIVSKNYPEHYPRNTSCTWQITVEPGRTVELNFTDFDVEGHSTCNFDHVTVSSMFLTLKARLH